jgi:hypothetical protein
MYEEGMKQNQQVTEAQIKISRVWKNRKAFLAARAIVADLIATNERRKENDAIEELSFLRKMESRSNDEKANYEAWMATNKHISFKKDRKCLPIEKYLKLPPYNNTIDKLSNNSLYSSKSRSTKLSINTTINAKSSRDPHIEALMLKFGKTTNINGQSRKTRFFDIQL